MGFRTWLVTLAVGLSLAPAALAQSTYPDPSRWSPPQTPTYYYVPQPALPPLPAPSWSLCAEGTRLQVQTADGARATCESLTVQVSGAEAVEVVVEGRQVHVRSGGPSRDSLRGSADRVTRSGPEGAVLTLEGNAKLTVVRGGKHAELVADRVSVNLSNGHVEADVTTPPPPATPPPPSCPVTPAPTTPVTPAISG